MTPVYSLSPDFQILWPLPSSLHVGRCKVEFLSVNECDTRIATMGEVRMGQNLSMKKGSRPLGDEQICCA